MKCPVCGIEKYETIAARVRHDTKHDHIMRGFYIPKDSTGLIWQLPCGAWFHDLDPVHPFYDH